MTTPRSPHYGTRLRIGLMIPHRNTICEPDAAAILPDGISAHIARMPALGTTRTALLAQADELGRLAQLLAGAKLDVLGFHCTAAATVEATIGADLARHIASVTGVAAVATSQALLAALQAFSARRIILVTPYTKAVNEHEIDFFAAHGITVVDHVWLGKTDAQGMASVAPDEWIDHVRGVRAERVNACVLSCANIRVAPILARLEDTLGMPVISSNQAMLWHCLRSAGSTERVDGYGALLARH
jgi:maleate isomerase